jgi:P-type conjugative transfer protein TrbJ
MKAPLRFHDVRNPIARAATAGLIALAPAAAIVAPAPATAQMTVYDPTNYAQNLLAATRALTQVNNQVRSLQNEAAMLTNMAKNLSRIDFPELQALNGTLGEIGRLMAQAEGIDFRADQLDAQFRRLFPQEAGQARRSGTSVAEARTRLDAAMASFRQTMAVQAQVVGNIQSDAAALSSIVARSQGAEGALQAAQATNQLLALTAKQQSQIQTLLAAQYRAQAVEQARRLQAESDARQSTARFLGSGSAYTPQ